MPKWQLHMCEMQMSGLKMEHLVMENRTRSLSCLIQGQNLETTKAAILQLKPHKYGEKVRLKSGNMSSKGAVSKMNKILQTDKK